MPYAGSAFLQGSGSLVLFNSSISVACGIDSCPPTPLLLNFTGNITLISANITAPSVHLIARGTMSIDKPSIVNTSGMGSDLNTSVGLAGYASLHRTLEDSHEAHVAPFPPALSSGGANGGQGARPWMVTDKGCEFADHTISTEQYGSLSALDQ